MTSQREPILVVEGLHVSYGRGGESVSAVEQESFELNAGEVLAIVGESGSGKSTTAMAILGLLPATATARGSIRIQGREVIGASAQVLQELRRGVVSLIPQDPGLSLSPTKTIGHHLEDTLRLRGVPRSQWPSEVVTHLELAGLENAAVIARQYPHQLSGGMRQRVLIAVAIASQPALIVADEPTSALDVTIQKRILDHLESLVAERGIALVLITHDLAVAADRSNRIQVMQAGRIVEHGPSAQLLDAPQHAYTKRLLAAAPALGTAGRVPVTHPDAGEDSHSAPPLIELDSVSLRFPLPRTINGPAHIQALDQVTLTASRGKTLAIVGESGSGKSTSLRVALGLLQPDSGEVSFDGQRLSELSRGELRRWRTRFQLVQQTPHASLNPRLSAFDSVVEPLRSTHTHRGKNLGKIVADLFDDVGLAHAAATRRPHELSGGQVQRVAIARALVLEPEALYLDEPVSALDVSVQAQVLALLTELQQRRGLTYLFVTHDLAVVAQIAHQVAVLKSGRVVETGSVSAVLNNPRHEYTRQLVESIPGRRPNPVIAAAQR